jgi:hypothetical protein
MRDHKQSRESSDVVPFARADGGAERTNNQLDEAGQAIVQLVGRAAEIAEGNTRQATDRARSCRISFMLPKTGSSNLRPRSDRSETRPIMPSDGCTGSTRR